MSARVIPLRPSPAPIEPDYSAHTDEWANTAEQVRTSARAVASAPPEVFKPRDVRWYAIETLAWVGAVALVCLVVWFVRWWMDHPQEISRWIT